MALDTPSRPDSEAADVDRGGPANRLGRALAAPELFPALAALVVLVFWATKQGGIAPTSWYPGALFLLGVLIVTVYAYRAYLPGLPTGVIVAAGLLAAFVLWNYLSILWADDQGAAWDGANRCLLYFVVFAVFALPPWRSRWAGGVMGLYAAAVAVVGCVVLIKAADSADPILHFFVGGPFSEPAGYHNANAALFTGASFIAVFLASRRETPWPARGLMLAAAGVLFQLALMPQSRGWLIAAPIALVVYVVIVPRVIRTLIVLLPLAIVCGLTAPTVLDVTNTVYASGNVGSALDHARSAMFVAAAVLLVVGAAIGFFDNRLEFSERTAQSANRAAVAVVAVGALVGVVVAISVIGNPATWARDRWHDIKTGALEHKIQGSRLGQGLGSNRYDFWRVAADEFTDSPVSGVGSENFAEDYVRDRHSPEEPTYPHNLPLQILSETGLVGGLLLGGFLVVALIGVGRIRLRSPDPLSRGIAAVAAVSYVYWFVHSTGDWFWAFPAITAPIFAWLGMGMRLDAAREPVSRRSPSRWVLPAALAGGAVSLIAAVSLFLPWAAAIDVNKASDSWGTDPKAAFDRLDQARDLNFLSAQPDLVGGAIASRLGDRARMRSYFDQALERDPRNWYATLELAALDGIEGDKRSALQRLDRVSELNPRESLTATVRRGVVSGKPVTLQALDADFLARYCMTLTLVPAPNGGCAAP